MAIPLPESLSGMQVERTIRLDGALFYLVTGALSALVDKNTYQQTGTLTPEDAIAALEAMFEDYSAQ